VEDFGAEAQPGDLLLLVTLRFCRGCQLRLAVLQLVGIAVLDLGRGLGRLGHVDLLWSDEATAATVGNADHGRLRSGQPAITHFISRILLHSFVDTM
jgi:hypothetical protein